MKTLNTRTQQMTMNTETDYSPFGKLISDHKPSGVRSPANKISSQKTLKNNQPMQLVQELEEIQSARQHYSK